MKRVLIVTFDFPPQGGTGAIRVTKFAKYLPEFGWQPIVLTTNRYGTLPTDQTAHIYRAGDVINSLFSPLRRYRVRNVSQAQQSQIATIPNDSWLGRLRDQIMIPDTKIGWLLPAIKLGRALIRQYQPQLIFSTSPPETAHLVAMHLSQNSGIPWVADLRDGWLFEPPNPALRQLPLRYRLEQRWERRMSTRTRFIVSSTLPIADDLKVRYPGAIYKIITITNGYDQSDFEGITRRRQSDGKFLLVHTGALVSSRQGTSAQAFFTALSHIQSNSLFPIYVQFVGVINPEEQALVHALNLSDKVTFIPPVSHRQAHQYQLDADGLLLITAPGQRSVATQKLFDYIGAGVPILALAENNAAAAIVQQYRLGITVPPDEPQAIAWALKELISRQRTVQDQNGLAAARHVFERRNLTAQLAELFERVVTQNEPV